MCYAMSSTLKCLSNFIRYRPSSLWSSFCSSCLRHYKYLCHTLVVYCIKCSVLALSYYAMQHKSYISQRSLPVLFDHFQKHQHSRKEALNQILYIYIIHKWPCVLCKAAILYI